MTENTPDEPGHLGFKVYGIDETDLPDGFFEHGAGEYPKNGCDHEAHHVATEVFRILRENYDWGEDVTGVSCGIED